MKKAYSTILRFLLKWRYRLDPFHELGVNIKIRNLIQQKKWKELVDEFQLMEIINYLSFQESMILANNLFVNNYRDDRIVEFAIQLLFKIKEIYHSEWKQDWKNDIYLAALCSINWQYKESFDLHREVYNRFSDPPEAVLIAMASFVDAPPESPSITKAEAEKLLKQAFQKKPSYEAALMLKHLYYSKRDKEQGDYWKTMSEEAERKNIHREETIPHIFNAQSTN